ncbi:MAG: 4'-phosphopantetheinyl transferase superfamily protein [Solirubrobacteraceae bacterium]|nr:4'-phosphopantetheinyl transferase superfamily protein [Solirubrobacteraceae bacterium]
MPLPPSPPDALAVSAASSFAPPTGAQAQLWWTSTTVPATVLAELRGTLDPATAGRVDGMVREADRRRTILAHGLLRRLVCTFTGLAPADVQLARHCESCDANDHGKPYLVAVDGQPAPVAFNLAHSADVVAVVVAAPGARVGVDVESVVEGFDWEPVRRHVFTDAEWGASGAAADPSAERFALWARKEASAKATGDGLSIDLRHVSISPFEGPGGARTSRLTAPGATTDLLVVDAALPTAEPVSAAVAVVGQAEPPALRVTQALLD